jgi:SAM-dependent methyltransferase
VLGGGSAGRERLRVLDRVTAPATRALLDAAGVAPGTCCLDAGCGGGDVTLELAARVGPEGRVVGIDLDGAKLELAREEARERGVATVEYRQGDLDGAELGERYDLVHARFLLTHVADRTAIVTRLAGALRPGGTLAVLDIDFRSTVSYPPVRAYERFCELYTASSTARGGDPYVGPSLPGLLEAAGLEVGGLAVTQPAGRAAVGSEADVKQIPALTMALIAEAAIGEGLTTPAEAEGLVRELQAMAADGRTVVLIPRTFGVWARRP